MTPHESNQILVQFTATASPWWLLLLVPAAGFAGWWLYRTDMPALARSDRLGLTAIRCVLIVSLVILAFRPNLVRRITLTYPGRIVFAVDDSKSMTARDNLMSDAAALRLARGLGLTQEHDAPFQTASEILGTIVGDLREFERYSKQAERSGDAFWDHAGKVQQEISQQFLHLVELGNLGGPILEKTAPQEASNLAAVQAQTVELRKALDGFFTGDRWPGHQAFDDYYRRADALALRFLDLQSVLDRQRIAQGDKTLSQTCDTIRAKPRLDLVAAELTRVSGTLGEMLPDQGFELRSLTTNEAKPLDAGSAKTIGAHDGTTDLVGRLKAIVEEPSEYPLSAVVLISDGQDTAHKLAGPVESAYSRQQSPILAAGVGDAVEPTDLAIAELVAPPIAVAGRDVTVELIVKSAIAAPTSTNVDLSCDGKPVSTTKVDLVPGQRISVPITFTPDQVGVFRYEVRLAPVPGEIFPTENNAAQFVLNVRKDPVRVLLLDWKPRWETRFALNVFQRMPYIDLNAIIAVTQKDQTLPRGANRGTWPDSPAALDLYDLVVIGDLPPDLLSATEWDTLHAWVEHHGGTLAFLAPRGDASGGDVPANQRMLLPVVPAVPAAATTAPAIVDLQRPDQLRLPAAGAVHPLTSELFGSIAPSAEDQAPAVSTLRPEAQTILLGPESGQPLVSFQSFGRGKTLLIDSDRLWIALNPTAHRAHLQMFVELVTWAVEGDGGPQDPAAKAPRLLVDRRRALADRGVEVWGQGVAPGAVVEAVADDKPVAEAPLQPTWTKATLSRAQFDALPARNITFRLKSDPKTVSQPVLVTAHDDELTDLARRDDLMQHLASATGGEYRPFSQLDRLLQTIEPKQRIERLEYVWRLWDSPLVMGLLVTVLSVEWVWRKFSGLV